MEFDYDVDNYSRKELLDLCDISDDSEVDIISATNMKILQYRDSPQISGFFEDVRDKLLSRREGFENWRDQERVEHAEDEEQSEEDAEEEAGDEKSPFTDDDSIGKGLTAQMLYKKQHQLGSKTPDPFRGNWKLDMTDKTTSSLPVQQQSYLGVNEVKQNPYAQGSINPRVKNMTHRLINVDSQYRSMPGGVSYKYPTPGSSTNYSVTLSETLKNVMSISVSSYEIPYAWIVIDPAKGNNKFVIEATNVSGTDVEFVNPLLPLPSAVSPHDPQDPVELAPGQTMKVCFQLAAGNWNLYEIAYAINAWKETSYGTFSMEMWNSVPAPGATGAANPEDSLFLSINGDGFAEFTNGIGAAPVAPSTFTYKIYFWGDEVGKICSHNCSALSNNYQNSLGWLLGFRTQSVDIGRTTSITAPASVAATAHSIWANETGIVGPSVYTDFAVPPVIAGISSLLHVPSTTTPTPPITPLSSSYISTLPLSHLWFWNISRQIPYLYIVLEDHNRNHNNKGVLNIIPAATVLNLPSYAKPSGIKLAPNGEAGQVCESNEAVDPFVVDGVVEGGIYDDPQHLTRAQLYTIASIKNNRTFRSPYSIPTGPSDSDILAKITLPNFVDLKKFGQFITDHGSSLSLNSRAYFGPVDLDRLTIKLLDNHGNLVNLNNRDWSFTLRVEQLYQF